MDGRNPPGIASKLNDAKLKNPTPGQTRAPQIKDETPFGIMTLLPVGGRRHEYVCHLERSDFSRARGCGKYIFCTRCGHDGLPESSVYGAQFRADGDKTPCNVNQKKPGYPVVTPREESGVEKQPRSVCG